MAIRSFNRITGKRINKLVGFSKDRDGIVPLSREVRMIDKNKNSIINLDYGEPILGVEYDGAVDASDFKGVFSDKEEFDVTVRDGKLYLTQGKNEYWFNILDSSAVNMPKMPQLDTTTSFEIQDIRQLQQDGHSAKFVAGYDKKGNKTVLAYIFDKDYNLIGAVDLHTTWKGEPSSTLMNLDRLSSGVKPMDGPVKAHMANDYPLVLQNDHEKYLLAPIILNDVSEENRIAGLIEGYVESHNRKGTDDTMVGLAMRYAQFEHDYDPYGFNDTYDTWEDGYRTLTEYAIQRMKDGETEEFIREFDYQDIEDRGLLREKESIIAGMRSLNTKKRRWGRRN